MGWNYLASLTGQVRRSFTVGLDEGCYVGGADHFTPVRNPELARVLALQKRTAESSSFFYPFAWLVLFFAVRTRWRPVLLLVTIPVLVVYANGRWRLVEMNSGAESAAFQALHQMQSNLSASRAEHRQQDYPGALPSMNLSPHAQKYYRFEYIPRRLANGETVGYIIQATPARCDCEFHRSFTITDEGRVFWTLEPRAATLSNMRYE
jgi:hypothetical protein